jgi:hypothetical protein
MRVVVLVLLCLFSEIAIAQTSECQSIPKASARLACYDKISLPIAPGKSATSKTPPMSRGNSLTCSVRKMRERTLQKHMPRLLIR